MKIFSIKENKIDILLFVLEMIGTAKKPVKIEGTSNVKDWEREQESWRRKMASVLAAPPNDKEIELKIVSGGAKGEGCLKVYILAKVRVNEEKEAKKKLASVWKDLYTMILFNKHVYSFKPVTKKKDLLASVNPIKEKHRVELCRSGVSLYSSSGPGFYTDKDINDSVLQLPLPLDSEANDLRFLFHFMAEYPSPLAVSIKVSPHTESLFDIQSYKPIEDYKEDGFFQQVYSIKQRIAEINRSKTKLCQLKVSVTGTEEITEPVINTVGSELFSEDTSLWQVEDPSSFNKEADDDNHLRIYSVEEVANVFCLPVPGNDGVRGIPVNYPYLPPNLSSNGAVLGFRKTVRGKETIRIAESDRDKHVYLLGQTGTGKTTLLYSMAMSDIREGRGVCVVDPHDDLHERLIARIPESRLDDVILFDPTDYEYPVGLNLLEGETEKEKSFLANELIQILRKVYDPHSSGFTGPIFEQAVRNAALTAMALPGGGTVVDVPVLLTQKDFTKGILEHIEVERIKTFWKEIWFKQGRDYAELLAYITSKFDNIHSDPIMRRVMGQTKSTFNFRQVMDEGKILLVNLSKGGLGELNSYLLGSILVVKLFTAALSRYDLPPEKRKPYCLYIDEFQNFTTDTVQSMLSEARKYRLALVLAHQNLKQLSEMTRQSVLGNVGSLVFFRPGAQDAHFVQEYLKPYFFEKDLIDMPNWSAVGRLMINASPSRPFVFQVDRDRTKEDRAVVKYVRDRSRSLYARSSSAVEKEINKRHSLNNDEEDDD